MDNGLESFFIEDDGEDIKGTDFWQSKLEKQGELVFSIKGSTIRVLIPRSEFNVIDMAKRSKEIIISRGPLLDGETEYGYEILFHTGDIVKDSFLSYFENSFLDLLPDRLVGKDLKCDFWVQSDGVLGKTVSKPARYRIVEKLPYLKPWSDTDGKVHQDDFSGEEE